MSSRDTAVGAVLMVIISVLSVLGFLLLPLEAAGGLDCEAPLRGSDPKESATAGFLVGRENVACSRRGSSRVASGAIGGTLFLVVGLAAVLAPLSRIERALFGDEDVEELYEE